MVSWSPRFLEQYQGQFRYGERPVGTRVTDGLRWTGPPRWTNDGSLDEAIEWIREPDRHRTRSWRTASRGRTRFFTGRPIGAAAVPPER